MGRKKLEPAQREQEHKKPLPLEGLADIQEAADLLGVSTKTIRRYIQQDKIVAHKIRNIWFIPREEIEKLFTAKEQETAAVTPMFDEISDSLRRLSHRMDQIEGHISRLATPENPELENDLARLAQLEDENRSLRDEIADLKDELSRGRVEPATMDPHTIKSRAEEIDALKATIVSNERGLALLREEVNEKDAVIREKEQEIFQLLEKLKEMESVRKQLHVETRKPGFLGNIMKGANPKS